MPSAVSRPVRWASLRRCSVGGGSVCRHKWASLLSARESGQTVRIAKAPRAESTIIVSAGRGFQSNIGEKTCFRLRSGEMNRSVRPNIATMRSTMLGIPCVCTLIALSPSSNRRILDVLAIHTYLIVIKKRSHMIVFRSSSFLRLAMLRLP